MKRAVLALLCMSLVPAYAQQVKDAAVAVEETEAMVTVTKVDKEKRTVTFRGPKGGVATLKVPEQSQNLDQVKPGQMYKVKYVEAVAVAIEKGGKPSSSVGEEVKLAPMGAKPGGTVVRTTQLAGVIDSIDYTNRYVAVRGPKGNTVSLKAADNVPLEQLAAGDRISVNYTEALAIEMVPAKKEPAQKAK